MEETLSTDFCHRLMKEAVLVAQRLRCEVFFHLPSMEEIQDKDPHLQLNLIIQRLRTAWSESMEDGKESFVSDEEKEAAIIGLRRSVFPSESLIDGLSLPRPELLFFQEFERLVGIQPEHPAVIYENTQWSYQKLNSNANRIAHSLLALKKDKQWSDGIPIAILFENTPEAVATILGVMKAGLAYVPLTITEKLNATHLKYFIGMSKPPLMIVQDSLLGHIAINRIADTFPGLSVFSYKIIYQDGEKLENPHENPLYPVSHEQLAYIMFSSGSTGKPKGIKTAHRGLRYPIMAIQRVFDIEPKDRIAWYALLTFDASLIDILTALGTGATSVVVPSYIRTDYPRFTTYMNKHRVTISTLVASVLRSLDPALFPELRGYITTGERAYRATFDSWHTTGREKIGLPRIGINGYGHTEVTGVTSLKKHDGEEVNFGKHPIPGLEWYVLTPSTSENPYPENLILVEDGQEGELYLAGKGVGLGYLDETAPYAQRYREIPHPRVQGEKLRVYQTGDCVKKINDDLYFVRRLDGQRKYLGELVELSPIESEILKFGKETIQQVKIIQGVQGKTGNSWPLLVAYLQARPGAKIDNVFIRRLYSYLKHETLCTTLPSRFYVVDNFPLTDHQKIDERNLKDSEIKEILYPNHPFRLKPKTEKQKKITEIWADILSISMDAIDLDSNFFYLGGDSIRVAALFDRIKREYNFICEHKRFSAVPTIRSLAYQVDHHISRESMIQIDQHTSGRGTPIILVSSVMGNASAEYKFLLENPSHRNPIFSINLGAKKDFGYVASSVEQLARDCIVALDAKLYFQRVESKSLLFVGYSSGGTLANAIVKQLQDAGKEAVVYYIDTPSAAYYQKISKNAYAEEILGLSLHAARIIGAGNESNEPFITLENLRSYDKEKQLAVFWMRLMEWHMEQWRLPEMHKKKQEAILACFLRLSNLIQTQLSYSPATVNAASLLMFSETVANSQEPCLGWDGTVLQAKKVEASHLSFVNDANWVKNVVFPEFNNFCRSAIPYLRMINLIGTVKKKYTREENNQGIFAKIFFSIQDNWVYLKSKRNRNKKKDIDDLFNTSSSKTVVVHAKPGQGSTVFFNCLTNQWAQGKILKKFDFVCIIRSDDIFSENVRAEELNIISRFLENSNHKLKVLMLVDGLFEESKELNSLFQSAECSFMVVSKNNDISRFLPKKIVPLYIAELTAEQRDKYIKGFFENEKQEYLGQSLNQKILTEPSFVNFGKIPLMLSFLCAYWLENHDRYEFIGCMRFILTKLLERYGARLKNGTIHSITFTKENILDIQERIQRVLELVAVETTSQKNEFTESILLASIQQIFSGIADSRLQYFVKDVLQSGVVYLTAEHTFKFIVPEIIEYLTVQYLAKKLTPDNVKTFPTHCQYLIEKHACLYTTIEVGSDNIYLAQLLNTSVLKGKIRPSEIIPFVKPEFVSEPMEKGELYRLILDKIGSEGIKILENELKNIDADYDLVSLLIEACQFKSNDSILLHLDRDPAYFKGKHVRVNAPKLYARKLAAIVSCKRPTPSEYIFELSDGCVLRLHRNTNGVIDSVFMTQGHLFECKSYLIEYALDVQEVTFKIPLSSRWRDYDVPAGVYHLQQESRPKKFFYSLEPMSFSLSLFPRYETVFRFNSVDRSYYLKLVHDTERNIVSAHLSQEQGEWKFIPTELLSEHMVFYIEEKIEDITSENIKDKIRIEEDIKDENQVRSDVLLKIDQLREEIVYILKDNKNIKWFKKLLVNLISQKLMTLSEKTILDNIPEVIDKLNRLVMLHKEISLPFDEDIFLKDVILDVNYGRLLINKGNTSIGDNILIHKGMDLLRNAFTYANTLSGKDGIIFEGESGAGKSTAIDAMLGHPLELRDTPYGQKLVLKNEATVDPDSCAKIGQLIGTSETIYTRGYSIVDRKKEEHPNLIFVDRAGPKDTRGLHYQLCTMISNERTIKNLKSVKAIVLVIPYADFLTQRGNLIIDFFKGLEETLPSIFNSDNVARRSVFLIVSKYAMYKNAQGNFRELVGQFLSDDQAKSKELDQESRAYEYSILTKRIKIWDFLLEMVLQDRVDFINTNNGIQRARMLKKYDGSKGIPKNNFKSLLDRDSYKNLSKSIHISIHTWHKLILAPYWSVLPEEILKIRTALVSIDQKIKETNEKILNYKRKISETSFSVLDLKCQIQDAKNLDITALSGDKGIELIAELRKRKEHFIGLLTHKLKGELLNLDQFLLEENDIRKEFQQQEELLENKLDELNDKIDLMGKEIAKHSDGKILENLSSITYRPDETLCLRTYKDGKRQAAFDAVRNLQEDDFRSGVQRVRADQYRGKLSEHIYVPRQYVIVPRDHHIREQFINNEFLTRVPGVASNAFAEGPPEPQDLKFYCKVGERAAFLSGAHFEVGLGRKASDDGKSMVYSLNSIWTANCDAIPHIRIDHYLLKSDVNEALIKNLGADMLALLDKKENIKKERSWCKEQEKISTDSIEFAKDQKKKKQEEIQDIEKQCIIGSTIDFIKDCEGFVQNHEKNIEDCEKNISLLKKELDQYELQRQIQQRDLHKKITEKMFLAVAIKTQFPVAKLLREFSDLFFKGESEPDELISNINTEGPSLLERCAEYRDFFDQYHKLIQDLVEKELEDPEVLRIIQMLDDDVQNTKNEDDDRLLLLPPASHSKNEQSSTAIQKTVRQIPRREAMWKDWKKALKKFGLFAESIQLIQPISTVTTIRSVSESYGFSVRNVPGDGNCFFHAVRDQLRNLNNTKYRDETHEDLRKLALVHIHENQDLYQNFIETDLQKYTDDNIRDGAWVDNVMILALSRVLNVDMIIIRSDGAAPTIFRREKPLGRIYLGYDVNVHYVSLLRDGKLVLNNSIEAAFQAEQPDVLFVEEEVEQERELFNSPTRTL